MITIMSSGRSPHLLFMLIVLFSLLSAKTVSGFDSGVEDDHIIKCIERERHALLMIKQSLVDDSGLLSSWGPEDDKKDCCKWQGVSCSNRTGHVVKLDLHGSYDYFERRYLGGNVSSSMLELQQLNYLNLSYNEFGGQPIPKFIGSLNKLRHLDLSWSGFGGRVPYQLGNLSRLQSLDLRDIDGMYAGKLEWLSNLSFLRNLHLDRVNLTQAVDWLQVISELPSLTEVHLNYCNLPSVTSSSSISFVNSSKSLSLLYLSENDLSNSNSIYLWLSNFSSSLVDLDLSSNELQGPIPEFAFSTMTALQNLDLSSNSLQGPIPEFAFSNMTALQNLDLSSNRLQGPIPEFAFSNMTALQTLDLSYNRLQGTIPEFAISNMTALQALYLSSNRLQGHIPEFAFSNMTALQALYLSSNRLQGPIPEFAFSNMTALQTLDLSSNRLQGPIPEFAFSNMTALQALYLSSNRLQGHIPEFAFSNMTALQTLDLSSNRLQGPIPEFAFSNMTALQTLDVSTNQLQGLIPEFAFSNMTSLQELDLSYNQIDGISLEAFTSTCNLKTLYLYSNNLTVQLSDLVFNLSGCTKHSLESLSLGCNMLGGSLSDFSEFISLKELNISNNQLNAISPRSIGKLFKLETLDISTNSLKGTITEAHMSHLSQLKYLDLSSNLLTFNFTSGWVPPFQLGTIILQACKLGPHFPKWLLTLTNYSWLDISNTNISNTIPTQFWEVSTNLDLLNLSYRPIFHTRGILPDLPLKLVDYYRLDLSSNDFEGPIPLFPSNVTSLNLSQNKFSGSISFLCSINGIRHLDLSNNLLSGELPNCSQLTENLVILNLANNKFSGKLPDLMGPKCTLQVLNLRNNHFIGTLPPSFNMCNELKIFDIGENNFSGPIPLWIGDSLPNLIILVLRSNQFNGSMPLQLCELSCLQLVDFSLNNILGTIPKCFNNLTAMVQGSSFESTIKIQYATHIASNVVIIESSAYENTEIIMWKGMNREYKKNLGFLTCIDLSSNKLSGEIPVEITSLKGLRSLNLSRNSLSGSITTKIGNLSLLDSLDLSNNKLIGEIPPSFSSLSFLGMLDLSNNNLSGKIPFNTKLQSFEARAYMGNPNLCGLPLPNKCLETEAPAVITHDNTDDDVSVTLEFYVCLAIGFIIGFWGVLGSLLLNRSWRHAYFQFLNHAKDRLYIAMVLNIAKLQRWSMTRS